MADFEKAYKKTMLNEGGISNRKSDRGGYTVNGLASKYHPDAAILTEDERKERYRSEYWGAYGKIEEQVIADKMFDISVNCGHVTANKMLQNAINKAEGEESLVVDGIIGSRTLGLLETYEWRFILSFLMIELIAHYVAIVDRDASQMESFKGWIKRALRK